MAETEEARKWLLKAWRDLETARRVGQGEPPLYDVAVYHCQQAAEKAVKAFLTFHDEAYTKTHDIEVLIDTASEIDASFTTLADAADALTPYATRYRYPNAAFAIEPERSDYEDALRDAQTIYDFVLNLLPPDAKPEK